MIWTSVQEKHGRYQIWYVGNLGSYSKGCWKNCSIAALCLRGRQWWDHMKIRTLWYPPKRIAIGMWVSERKDTRDKSWSLCGHCYPGQIIILERTLSDKLSYLVPSVFFSWWKCDYLVIFNSWWKCNISYLVPSVFFLSMKMWLFSYLWLSRKNKIFLWMKMWLFSYLQNYDETNDDCRNISKPICLLWYSLQYGHAIINLSAL